MVNQVRAPFRTQIRSLLTVIFGGVIFAIVVASVMLYYYNPTGRYLAKNVMLSPLISSELYFSDTNAVTGNVARYVFEGVEFSYYDPVKKEWRRVVVAPESYQHFYEQISEERSLATVTDDIVALFNQANPAIVTLKVRPDNKNEQGSSSKVFQEIQIVNEGDYYRVQLREAGPTGTWAYFYHPKIHSEALSQFVRP